MRSIALIAPCLLALSACERQPVPDMQTEATVIVGGAVLAGRGLKQLSDAVIVIEGETITGIGESGSVEIPEVVKTVDATGLILIPGFIDAHVHVAFADPHEIVAKGVTTVRDLAWTPEEIWPLVARSRSPRFDGPLMIAAGQMLTVERGYPTRAGWAPQGVERIVRPGEARDAVAEQVERGASVIKVALNAAAGPTLSPSTLNEIVVAAHDEGLRVTAHITGRHELRKALVAGVDEMAHMLMSEERISDQLIGDMVAADMTVVPTLAIRFGNDRKLAIDNLKRFVAAEGRIVYGTDLGNAGAEPGIDAREVDAMSSAGLSGREIIASATVDAANYLGLGTTGVLATGMEADIVAVSGDPVAEPNALTNVEMVWRDGHRVR
jgi:imidazolonepropionase-like amidohydrolase